MKMPSSQRAKQFLPFDALPGLRDALRQKEEERARMEMPAFAEEQKAEMDLRLAAMSPGDVIDLTCLQQGRRVRLRGTLQKIDRRRRVLVLDDREVAIDRILEIS